MITYVKGDLFASPAKILVNTVNVVGVMGKGIALEFKKRYPDMFMAYKALCEEEKLKIGSLFLWKKSEKWVMLFPTKQNWRQPSKIEYIEQGLIKFAANWDKLGADSIAFPRLGCGNGNLDWEIVRPLMEKYLNNIPMQIYVYVDNYQDPKPEHLDISEMEKWLNGEGSLSGYERFSFRFHKRIQQDDSFIELRDLEESQICEMWSFVRDAGIVKAEELPGGLGKLSEMFLEAMIKLNDVARVIVSQDGKCFDALPNAYQYIAE